MDTRTTHFDHVLEDALALDAEERKAMAFMLAESLEDADVDEVAIAAAWDQEALRRLQELDSGAVQAIPWDVVKARLLAL